MFKFLKRLLPAFAAIWLLACAPESQDDAAELAVANATVSTVLPEKVSLPAGHFQIGKTATSEEIAGWDIDVRPDGLGLPDGQGTAEEGEPIYEKKCALCHGSFGEGVGRHPVLAGGVDTLTEARPEKTVGSFWPYASTLWDYIHRAMPFAEPESLTDNEVYALTAYVLYLNDLVDYDTEYNQDNLATVEMPNKDGFYIDDRPDVQAVPCMSDCKDPATIVITSEVLAAVGQQSEQPDDENPKARAMPADTATGQSVYQQACALCHAAGVAGSPVVGNKAEWTQRLTLGRDALVASVINGKGTMPAKGGQPQLSDEEVAEAVDFMLAQSTQ